MKKLFAVFAIAVAPLCAQQSTQGSTPEGQTPIFAPFLLAGKDGSGHVKSVSVNSDGSINVSAASGGGAQTVIGGAAVGAATSGNPVYVAGKDSSGNVQAIPATSSAIADVIAATGIDGVPNSSTGSGAFTNNAGTALSPRVSEYVFNGATWDRKFTCNTFAPISVTAGNTTQIVGLSGTTVIRVCSVTVSISSTGTFTLLSGTGTNCGTPANSTGAMPLTAGVPANLHFGSDGAYRGTAGGEFCVAAATGNVTGFAMVAQY